MEAETDTFLKRLRLCGFVYSIDPFFTIANFLVSQPNKATNNASDFHRMIRAYTIHMQFKYIHIILPL